MRDRHPSVSVVHRAIFFLRRRQAPVTLPTNFEEGFSQNRRSPRRLVEASAFPSPDKRSATTWGCDAAIRLRQTGVRNGSKPGTTRRLENVGLRRVRLAITVP